MAIQPLAPRNHRATLTALPAALRSTLGTRRGDSPNTAPSVSTSARVKPRMIISLSLQPCHRWRRAAYLYKIVPEPVMARLSRFAVA